MKVKLSDRAQAQLKITVFIILFGTGAIVVVIGLGIFVSALFGIVVGLVFLIRYGMYVPYKDKAKLPTAIGIWIYSIIIILISFRLYGNWPTDSDTGEFSHFLFFITMGMICIILGIPLAILIAFVAEPIEGKIGYGVINFICPDCDYKIEFENVKYDVSKFHCKNCRIWVDRTGIRTDPPSRKLIWSKPQELKKLQKSLRR